MENFSVNNCNRDSKSNGILSHVQNGYFKPCETRYFIQSDPLYLNIQTSSLHVFHSQSGKSQLHIWTTILLVWVLALVLICDMENFRTVSRFVVSRNPSIKKDVPVPLQLRVGVFYEALCPDSRDFIMRQLMPVYDVMNDVLAIDLIPYGKASSRIQSDGRKVFSCQHGEKECKANIVHACVAKHVENERRRLNIVNCMIDINLRRNQEPIAVGNKCVTKYDENWSLIEKCSIGEEGENLLYHLGKMTDDLTPKVYFIPTISLDDKLDNQKLILRDFKQAVCDAYTGPKHSVCTF